MKKSEIKVGDVLALDTSYGNSAPKWESDIAKVKVVGLDGEWTEHFGYQGTRTRTGGIEIEYMRKHSGMKRGDRDVLATARKLWGPWDETLAMVQRFEVERAESDKARREEKERDQRNLKRLDKIQQLLGYKPAARYANDDDGSPSDYLVTDYWGNGEYDLETRIGADDLVRLIDRVAREGRGTHLKVMRLIKEWEA